MFYLAAIKLQYKKQLQIPTLYQIFYSSDRPGSAMSTLKLFFTNELTDT